MTEDCKSILLLSNEPSANSKENTLSSFSNSIPPDYLAKHQSLKVAVRGLVINLKMVKGLTLTPASKHMPALIQITRENWADCVGAEDSLNYLTISMFESKYALKLYVDKDTHYTPESLYRHFATQTINHYRDNPIVSSLPANPLHPIPHYLESFPPILSMRYAAAHTINV